MKKIYKIILEKVVGKIRRENNVGKSVRYVNRKESFRGGENKEN